MVVITTDFFFNDVYKINLPAGEVTKINKGDILLWEKAKIYGVKWAGGTSASMTRTDDAANFSSPTIGNGTTAGSSPFDACYPWSEMKTETINGSVFVRIPKFWYKWTKSSATMTLQIANKKVPGFYCSPMHADRGDGNGERDYVYISKYRCNSSYKSVAGASPLGSITIGTARNNIAKLGTGYFQYDYAAFWTIRMLFLVEWATWDGQSVLKNTNDFASGTIVTGKTASMAYHTGLSSDGYSTQYRWIEDLWENGLDWIDGIYFSGVNVYCIKNPNEFATGSNGTLIGTRTTTESGYIKSWTIPTAEGLEYALIPASVSSSSGYTMDGYYYQSSGTVLYTGGARTTYNVHGPWMMYTDFAASSTSSIIYCRIMYLPS